VSSAAAERVRLFVALDLPEEARSELLRWQAGQVPAEGLRLTRPDALHATLCFLGWRSEDEIDRIGAACRDALRGLRRSGLALGRALWLPPRRPRVLAVELDDPTDALQKLQASLSGALGAGGWYTPEKRPYLAHVTVARAPARARVRAVELSPPPRLEFLPTAVTLYRSRLERAGARYEPLVRGELT
jgi:2'-5' RNA ligase